MIRMWNSAMVNKAFLSPWMVMLAEASEVRGAVLYLGDVSVPGKTHLPSPISGRFSVISLPPADWLAGPPGKVAHQGLMFGFRCRSLGDGHHQINRGHFSVTR